MQKETIAADYNGRKIMADILPAGSAPKVFCMHGAGNSNRKFYDPLRQLLTKNSISSCALDFIGHGETGGSVGESSLKSRTEQAQAVIEKAKITKPLAIIAGSMSGYNAIKLTEMYPVLLLVLFAPAVYRTDAYEIPFGDMFSSLIREPKSWDNTDAWQILNNFTGKLLIIAAEKDTVIPPGVIQKMYANASNAVYREVITIPDAPHKLFGIHFKEHPEDLKMVADKITALLQ